MCEYAKYKNEVDKSSVMTCTVTGTLCTLCVLGNAQTYIMQKQKANKGVGSK